MIVVVLVTLVGLHMSTTPNQNPILGGCFIYYGDDSKTIK
jgi:hypothetical protein